jgi:TPR repeat protein
MNRCLLASCVLLLALPALAQQAAPSPLPPPIWNNAEAVLRVGTNYSRGQGVPKDEARALQYYQRAAELGSAVAMDNVGTYYAMGRGVAADKVRAIAWYRRAAAHGYVPAMNNLGVLYSAQMQGKPDYCQALEWFKKSAEGGNATGMWHLGQAYQQGLCPQARSAKLARQWLQNAVDIGSQSSAVGPDKYAAEQAAQELRKL